MPLWTPDGVTVHAAKIPELYCVDTVTLPGDRDVVEIDLTALSPKPTSLIFAQPTKVRLMEIS